MDNGAFDVISKYGVGTIAINATIENDGSITTQNRANYNMAVGLYNGCVLELFLTDSRINADNTQRVFCEFALDYADTYMWAFKGKYFDSSVSTIRELIVSFTPTVDPESSGNHIAITPVSQKYIVTLTPTALDYSGTMDKTVAEINAAYEAGQEIVFRVYVSSSVYYEIGCTDVHVDQYFTYPKYCAVFVYDNANVIVKVSTPEGDDGTLQTYYTSVYSLTPAS